MKDHQTWDPAVAVALRIALSMAMAGIVTTFPGAASACGPTPSVAHALLPVEGATAVPINAVLIASSSHQRVTFTLREAGSGRTVPVSVACETPEGAVAQLCLGRPGGLHPNTGYIWTALPEPLPGAQPKPGVAEVQGPERAFTTGAAADLKAPLSDLTPYSSPLLTVEVLEHETTAEPPMCGSVNSTRLRLSIAQLSETVVLLGAGMGGLQRYAEPAPLLTAQSPSLELAFDTAPGPLAVRLIDGAGNVRHLPPWSPPTAFGAGCSAAPGVPSPGAAAVVLLALLLLVMTFLGASRQRRLLRARFRSPRSRSPLLTILGLVAGGTGLLWALPGRAAACGATPSQAFPLSPPAAATDVPLNAVLIASSTYPRVSFTLRETTTGKAVPVSVACQLESDAQVCQAHPGPLLPNTAYSWNVVPEPPASQETYPVPPEQTFITGDRVDTQAAFSNPLPGSAPPFTVDILQNQKVNPSLCGVTHNVRLRFAFPRLDEPVVLAGAGMGGLPQFYDQPAPLLGPGAGSTERRFFGAPSCLALRLIDMAGNVRHFAPWCPPADEATGCAAAPGRPTSPGGLLIAGLLLGLVFRRRRQP
jgi:MYXO-CTERM domain-containing protein